MTQGDLGDARSAADAARVDGALPAHRALADELDAGVEFVSGRFGAALAGFQTARLGYADHHLNRGWGFLIDIEVAEAALWHADQCSGEPDFDLINVIRQAVRRAGRHLERMPYLRGYHTALRGTLAARTGNARKAERLYRRSLAQRPSDGSYLDNWVTVRMVVERYRLGGDREHAMAAIDAVANAFESDGLHGMSRWLEAARRVAGLGR